MTHLCHITTVHLDPVQAEYVFVRQQMTNAGVVFDLRLLCGYHAEAYGQHSNQETLPVAIRPIRPSPVPYDTDYLLGIVRELLGPEVELEKKNGRVWLR